MQYLLEEASGVALELYEAGLRASTTTPAAGGAVQSPVRSRHEQLVAQARAQARGGDG